MVIETQLNDFLKKSISQYFSMSQVSFIYGHNICIYLPLLTKKELIKLLTRVEKREVKMNILCNDLVEQLAKQINNGEYSDENEPGLIGYIEGFVDHYTRVLFCESNTMSAIQKTCGLLNDDILNTQVDFINSYKNPKDKEPLSEEVVSRLSETADTLLLLIKTDKDLPEDVDKKIRSVIPRLAQVSSVDWFEVILEASNLKKHIENIEVYFKLGKYAFSPNIFVNDNS